MRVVIAGAGIGGLTAALCLHAEGIRDVSLVEAAGRMRPLGVGLNILPNAVAVLTELGLERELAARAVATEELAFYHRCGQLIWREPRGLAAGYRCPQLSVHRGHLHAVLGGAVRRRLGDAAIRVGSRVTGYVQSDSTVRVELSKQAALLADVLVGADGIASAVRAVLYPHEGPPAGNGMVTWRGTSWARPFLSGASMVVVGDDRCRVVVYPIRRDPGGGVLVNWVAARPGSDGPAPDGDGRLATLLRHFGDWRFDWLDLPGIFAAADEIHLGRIEDRDPLPRWSFGRITLLGDAAHAMYPMGSNGATQAIIDAGVLARALTAGDSVGRALVAYEAQRRPATTQLQIANRGMGPEAVITLAHQRAPNGFTDIREVIPAGELAEISARYARLGECDLDTVNADRLERHQYE